MVDVWIMAPALERRDWLSRSVSGDASLRVAGIAATFPFLRSLMSEASADVAVIDLQPQSGSTILRDWLLELRDLVAIVLLTSESDPAIFNWILHARGGGILQTDASPEQIVQAVKAVASGLMIFDTAVMPQRPDEE